METLLYEGLIFLSQMWYLVLVFQFFDPKTTKTAAIDDLERFQHDIVFGF